MADKPTEKQARSLYQSRVQMWLERARQTVEARHMWERAKQAEAEAAQLADEAYLELRDAIRREAHPGHEGEPTMWRESGGALS